jgi:sulfur carrier protein ThiS
MQVQVKISADLRNISVQAIELADGSNAMCLIQQIGIPAEEVGVLSINGQQATFDQLLRPGDVVHIVPPIGGG